MCITYPGVVIDRDGPTAVVETPVRTRRASTLLVPDIAVGDWVIVGAGSILRRLDRAEALAISSTLDAARAATPAQGGRP
jgi:hydrogenase assembly chaperone HypC/HupF